MRHASYLTTGAPSSTFVFLGRGTKRIVTVFASIVGALFVSVLGALYESRRRQAQRILDRHPHLMARVRERTIDDSESNGSGLSADASHAASTRRKPFHIAVAAPEVKTGRMRVS
jgi:hypothetical protein